MLYFNRIYMFILICTAVLACTSLSAAAQKITVLSTGLYQIIPANADEEFKNSKIISLKEHALLENTDKIEAIVGSSFGFEFVLNATAPVSTIIKMHHPKLPETSGSGYHTINTFPVIIQPNEKLFAGWYFLHDKETQAGKWSFEFDLPDSPVIEFTVRKTEEFVYDGNRLDNAHEDTQNTAQATLPYGKILTRHLVRTGIFSSLAKAKKKAVIEKQRGYEPFIFVREKTKGKFTYFLFIKMFDSKAEATSFATTYRKQFRSKAVAQKIQVKLAPM